MLVLPVFFFINLLPRVRVFVPLDKGNADSPCRKDQIAAFTYYLNYLLI